MQASGSLCSPNRVGSSMFTGSRYSDKAMGTSMQSPCRKTDLVWRYNKQFIMSALEIYMVSQDGTGNVRNSLFTQCFHGFLDFSRPLSKFQTISSPLRKLNKFQTYSRFPRTCGNPDTHGHL